LNAGASAGGKRASASGLLRALLLAALLTTPVARAADIVIGVPNWPSVRVSAQLVKLVLEEELGLTVELQGATNPVIFEAMSKGSIDLHPEVWLPNQQSLFDRYEADLVRNLHPAIGEQGMCVNGAAQRAGVHDIADLTDPARAPLFDSDGDGRGEVFIGAPGWSSTLVERIRAATYGYGEMLELLQLDEGLADTQLAIAQRRNLPWVGFCYTPHHRFVVHPDLRLLSEPAGPPGAWKVVLPADDPLWARASRVAMAWPRQSVQPVYARALERSPLGSDFVRLGHHLGLEFGELVGE
jgi:glycine betaine/proline transport system substrate-binding protein